MRQNGGLLMQSSLMPQPLTWSFSPAWHSVLTGIAWDALAATASHNRPIGSDNRGPREPLWPRVETLGRAAQTDLPMAAPNASRLVLPRRRLR